MFFQEGDGIELDNEHKDEKKGDDKEDKAEKKEDGKEATPSDKKDKKKGKDEEFSEKSGQASGVLFYMCIRSSVVDQCNKALNLIRV